YSQASIRAYMLEFAAQVKAPVYLYNIPQFTNELRLETSLELLATGAFAGIKDSLGRWEDFVELQRSGREGFTGNDAMYSRVVRAGGYGAISGVASVVPELMVAVDRRARAGEDTSELDAKVAEIMKRASEFAAPLALKEAAAIRGLKVGPHASPLGVEECRKLESFRAWFPDWLKTLAC